MFTNNILSIVTWLPALGAILILALFKKDQNDLIKKFATAWLALDFIASLWLLGYDRGLGGMQFLEDHRWIPIIGARYQMGADGVSVLLIVLTTFLGLLAALSSWSYIQSSSSRRNSSSDDSQAAPVVARHQKRNWPRTARAPVRWCSW